MVPKFIEVIRTTDIEPILINTSHIVRVEAYYERGIDGCRLIMSGNFPDIYVKQNYVTIFEELQ